MKKLLKDVVCILLTIALAGTFLAAATEGLFAELADSPIFSFSRVKSNGVSEKGLGTGGISGVYSRGENTREELISRWNTIKADYGGAVYSTVPSVSAPYGTGCLVQGYLNDALKYLNFHRKIAKMPELTLSQAKCVSSQYGAVLLAANNIMSHNPPKPPDMSTDFYNKGYSSTNSSCLAQGSGYDGERAMRPFIKICFDDSVNVEYIKSVSHRRWFLSPDLTDIGFGQATSTESNIYTVAPVVSDFNESISYNYISWPSSGWFPSEFIHSGQSWNISLNPDKYFFPVDFSPTVKITRQSDGKVFNLTMADNNYSKETKFLTFDEQFYAVPLNITFHIGSDNHIG
ncbi:MAG: CAP domain-containing protein, partial [Clostridiales bacterium]|nr:CAP domain-containing protein [Clostridiales bacterium]